MREAVLQPPASGMREFLSKQCSGKGSGFEKVSFADTEPLQLQPQAKPPMDVSTTVQASCTVNTQDLKCKYDQVNSQQLQEKAKLLQKFSEGFVQSGHREKEFQVILLMDKILHYP